jgi:hypothetical protein
LFNIWARIVRGLGHVGGWLRKIGLLCFVFFLVSVIVLGIPLVLIGLLLLYPMLRKPLAAYVERLKQPSEGREPALAS